MNRQSQYKKSGLSTYSLRNKREEKRNDTKQQRNDLIMRRRGKMPLAEIQEDKLVTLDKTRFSKQSDSRKTELEQWKQTREKKKQNEQKKRKKERPPFFVSAVINKSKPSPKKMVKKSLPKKAASKKAPTSSDSVESHDDHVITKKKQLGVQHPAWIPGAKLATPMETLNFEEAFKNTFSPFKFTGSTLDNTSVAFTFHKDITMSPAKVAMFRSPGDEGESPLDESCDPMRSDTSLEHINHSIAHNHELTNALTNTDDHDETINGNSHEEEETTEPIEEEIEEEVNIFLPFRKLHTDVIHKFTILCEEWDKKLAKLETIDEPPPEEVLDQIRITICQARLLTRSKLKQYIGLVDEAEDMSSLHKTTPEDLEGFWDMVYIQVSDIENKFSQLVQLEDSNWEQKQEEKKQLRRSKRRASAVASNSISTARNKTPSDKLKAARAKRQEALSKLREMKLAAMKTKKQSSPPRLDSPVHYVGSGLTPPPVKISSSIHTSDDVPTANLISITPQRPISLSDRKTPHYTSSSSDTESAFVTKLIQVNASKKLIEEMGTNVIMSPARRSIRLSRKSFGRTSCTGFVVDSVMDLPEDVEFAYRPNKAMFF